MLTTNTNLKIRLNTAAPLCANSHQLPDTISIEHLKRIVLYDLSFDIVWQETAGVVSTQTKRRLRQVVCTKREKLRMSRNTIRHQRCAWQLDHGADEILDRHSMFAHHLARNFMNELGLLSQFFTERNEWHHDLELYFFAFTLYLARRFKDRTALHPRHFRE